ncbi:MAG: serine/threonine-protein kinase, partial [Deltaproteobacteria bacterium]
LILLNWLFGLQSVYFVGLMVNTIIDVVSRQSYRKERIIEAQRVTIAHERARSEELLKREISHQVAERSRELGASLARMEGALDVGTLAPGDRFDARYLVTRTLGSGGMGIVYEVERITDEQRFSLKILTGRISGAAAARFAREAEIGARVHHPNLIGIVDIGVSTGVPFLVMDLVRGKSLEDLRPEFGSAAWALPILEQIAAGVSALHDAGVVHRDLKPANVLVANVGGASVARISDFGISRFGEIEDSIDPHASTLAASVSSGGRGGGLTATGALLGTPFYMPPEAAKGARAVDASGDVFAFGIIAYEVLTGRAPFELPAVMQAFAGAPLSAVLPIEIEGLGPAFARVVLECLSADPALRPRMRSIQAALRGP